MKNRFRTKVYDFLISICSIVMIVLVAYLLYDRYKINKEESLMKELQLKRQEVTQATEENIEKKEDEGEEATTLQEKQILPEYKQLYEENHDMYGWIKIEGTNIDYPVMFTPKDPNFYSDKNWQKEVCYRQIGTTIWIDGRTTKESENIIIYGHNSKSYTMFRSLMNYKKEEDFYQNHKYIEFNTLYERQIYEIIAVSKAVVYYGRKPEGTYSFYDHIELNSKEDFDAYIQNVKQNAYYNIDVNAEYGDQLITLTTCDYFEENARLIIVAKKI